jgi:hypothetical protein
MTVIQGSAFDWHTQELAITCLSLTVAAGGKIVVRRNEMMDLSNYRLVVTQDDMTGDRTYEAITDTPTSRKEAR